MGLFISTIMRGHCGGFLFVFGFLEKPLSIAEIAPTHTFCISPLPPLNKSSFLCQPISDAAYVCLHLCACVLILQACVYYFCSHMGDGLFLFQIWKWPETNALRLNCMAFNRMMKQNLRGLLFTESKIHEH